MEIKVVPRSYPPAYEYHLGLTQAEHKVLQDLLIRRLADLQIPLTGELPIIKVTLCDRQRHACTFSVEVVDAAKE